VLGGPPYKRKMCLESIRGRQSIPRCYSARRKSEKEGGHGKKVRDLLGWAKRGGEGGSKRMLNRLKAPGV